MTTLPEPEAETMKAWALCSMEPPVIVIGTRDDAEAKAEALVPRRAVFGPYEFTIAIKS